MLYLREIKKVVWCVSYILYVAAIVIALQSQGVFDFGENLLHEPQKGENYGTEHAEVPEQIMPAAISQLWEEFCENSYQTYPIGFVKYVKLEDSEQQRVAEIISELTGTDVDTVLRDRTKNSDGSSGGLPSQAGSSMDYGRFKERMRELDHLLGGNSRYKVEDLVSYSNVPVTYEKAKERYGLARNRDKITGGYARLFSDYSVAMVMSVLPVFLAVILCLKDRRAKMSELVYCRKASAAKVVLCRYFALLTAAMLPVCILSFVSNVPLWAAYSGVALDYLAPLRYDFGWIMPSAMISTAAGMFLTELTGTPVAVFMQGFWWLSDIYMGIRSVPDGYALFRLAPRHNAGADSYFRTQDFLDHFNDLFINRLLFAGASMLLVVLTIYIYEARRRGRIKWRAQKPGFRFGKSQK